MTFRIHLFALVTATTIAWGGDGIAQAKSYALPLDGTVTSVEASRLSEERNAGLREALERKRDLMAKAPAVTGLAPLERVLARPQSDVLRIRVRFAELPQRAMEPVLLVNDQAVGRAVGPVQQVEGGVEVEFLVLPQLAGTIRIAPDTPIELAVQMGEDRRTRSVLRSEEATKALREALSKNGRDKPGAD